MKYSVNQSGISRCGDDFVVTIGLQRGDVSATDKAFVLDGVGVIVIARPDIYQPF
ncbi:hypothetical protein [Aeromicrobium sp. CF3.5]|uniref:hypothetical protein n=1 Tax=Aeromicrobium sp. CF3.5 TaxID=3373078 RepID=UPI003EE6592C